MNVHKIKRALHEAGAKDIVRCYESIRLAAFAGRDLNELIAEFRRNQPALFDKPRKVMP